MSTFGDGRVMGFGGIDAAWAEQAIREAESENGVFAGAFGPFPAELFIVDGDPEEIARSAARWNGFGERALDVSRQVEGFDLSRFVGVEGELYAAVLSRRLGARLTVTGKTYRRIGFALETFGAELARLQGEMQPIAAEAPGLYRELQQSVEESRQGNLVSNALSGVNEESRRLWLRWKLIRGQAGDVQRQLTVAVQDCEAEIRAASLQRFTENSMVNQLDLASARLARAFVQPVRDPAADSVSLRMTEISARLLQVGDAASGIAPSLGSVVSSGVGAVGSIAGLVAGAGNVAAPPVTAAAAAIAAAAPFIAATSGVVGSVIGAFGPHIATEFSGTGELAGGLWDALVVGGGVERRLPGSIPGPPSRYDLVLRTYPQKLLAEALGWRFDVDRDTGVFTALPNDPMADTFRSRLTDSGGIGVSGMVPLLPRTPVRPERTMRRRGGERTAVVAAERDGFALLAEPGTGYQALFAPVPGGERVFVLIDDPDAPLRYRFAQGTPEGGRLRRNIDGTVSILDAGENTVATIKRPWAFDALGRPVETEYTVEDGGLVQSIHPTSDTFFPVLADPETDWRTTPVAPAEESAAPLRPEEFGSGKPSRESPSTVPSGESLLEVPPAELPSAATPDEASQPAAGGGEPSSPLAASVLQPAQQALSLVSSGLSALSPVVEAQGAALDALVPGAGTSLARAASSLVSAGSGFASAATSLTALGLATEDVDRLAALAGIASGLNSGALSLLSAAVELAVAAPQLAAALISHAGPELQSAATAAAEAITQAAPALIQSVVDSLNTIVPAIQAALPSLQATLGQLVPWIQSTLPELATRLTTVLSDIAPRITEAAATVGTQAGSFATQLTQISQAVSVVGLGLSAASALPSLLAVLKAVPDVLTAVGAFAGSLAGATKAVGMTLAPGLTSGFIETVKILAPITAVDWQRATTAVYPGVMASQIPGGLPTDDKSIARELIPTLDERDDARPGPWGVPSREKLAADLATRAQPGVTTLAAPAQPGVTTLAAPAQPGVTTAGFTDAWDSSIARIESLAEDSAPTPSSGTAPQNYFAAHKFASAPAPDFIRSAQVPTNSDAEFAKSSVSDRDLIADATAAAPGLLSGALSMSAASSDLNESPRKLKDLTQPTTSGETPIPAAESLEQSLPQDQVRSLEQTLPADSAKTLEQPITLTANQPVLKDVAAVTPSVPANPTPAPAAPQEEKPSRDWTRPKDAPTGGGGTGTGGGGTNTGGGGNINPPVETVDPEPEPPVITLAPNPGPTTDDLLGTNHERVQDLVDSGARTQFAPYRWANDASITPPRRWPHANGDVSLAYWDGRWPGTDGIVGDQPRIHMKPLDVYGLPDDAHLHKEGDVWWSTLPDGRRVKNTIPFGNGNRSVDQEVQDAQGNWIRSRVVDNGRGGYQRWTDAPDHSASYANSEEGGPAERWVFGPGTSTAGEPDHVYTVEQQKADAEVLAGGIPTTPEGWASFRSLEQAGADTGIALHNAPPGYSNQQLNQDLSMYSAWHGAAPGTPERLAADAAKLRLDAAGAADAAQVLVNAAGANTVIQPGFGISNQVRSGLTDTLVPQPGYGWDQIRADLALVQGTKPRAGGYGPFSAVDLAWQRLESAQYTKEQQWQDLRALSNQCAPDPAQRTPIDPAVIARLQNAGVPTDQWILADLQKLPPEQYLNPGRPSSAQPWDGRTDYVTDPVDGVSDFGAGIGRSAWDAVTGAVDSVTNPLETVKNMAPLVGLGGEGAPGVIDSWKQLGKDTVSWDDWARGDYAYAAGKTTFNIVSSILGDKGASKISRIPNLPNLPGSKKGLDGVDGIDPKEAAEAAAEAAEDARIANTVTDATGGNPASQRPADSAPARSNPNSGIAEKPNPSNGIEDRQPSGDPAPTTSDRPAVADPNTGLTEQPPLSHTPRDTIEPATTYTPDTNRPGMLDGPKRLDLNDRQPVDVGAGQRRTPITNSANNSPGGVNSSRASDGGGANGLGGGTREAGQGTGDGVPPAGERPGNDGRDITGGDVPPTGAPSYSAPGVRNADGTKWPAGGGDPKFDDVGHSEGLGDDGKIHPRYPEPRTLTFKEGSVKDKTDEFRLQIDRQVDGLNRLTAQQVLDRLDSRAWDSRSDQVLDAAKRRFRAAEIEREIESAVEKLAEDPNALGGKTPREFATDLVDQRLEGLSPLHEPDMRAGGADVIGSQPGGSLSFGDRSVNKSLGSQWSKRRLSEPLREYVEEMVKNGQGDSLLNIRWELQK
ncbi:polymorphic toxin type 15 domain-containing protein [Nocardia huaxiensis]|uniref:polymorphic toxin type 15 domain-containing protein n=1 Tax=Nocardia huaxiensis TaxID=2755382 RepID=UPI001E558671|nr:polymorphic toxin type 15 domain-containing protein [Nocardia huaxiensis]UFS93413.1 polymorphic toxin type 15 domain-containing protein [Nocardia huaxiensis]